ncbi:hypothetical protein H0H92_008683 [Tricholoma furcatifolium]|nr:hypothetical protein H0H92_008683 [Tricholoma furcatifolium]
MHFQVNVVTTIFTEEMAYINLYSEDAEWANKIPHPRGPLPTLSLSKPMDAESVRATGPLGSLYQICLLNTTQCDQIRVQSSLDGLMKSYIKALMHFEANNVCVVNANYTADMAYIHFESKDVEWAGKIPSLLTPLPELGVGEE